eukprot:8923824-Pyramimonas_sp.AAC.1
MVKQRDPPGPAGTWLLCIQECAAATPPYPWSVPLAFLLQTSTVIATCHCTVLWGPPWRPGIFPLASL